MAYTHIPKASALHRHNSQLNLPDLGGAEGSASKPLQEILDFLAAHYDQAA